MNRQSTIGTRTYPKHVSRDTLVAATVMLLAIGVSVAQTVEPPFDTDYTVLDLGSVPGLPPSYGGLTFLIDDPDTLLIGGEANTATGQLYAIGVVRDAENHITGFVGMATPYAEAANNDGGVAYGPGDVLFLSRYPLNEIGQVLPGSTVTDKIVALDPVGVVPSPGGLNFIPDGFPGAGLFKSVSWEGGEWYTLTLAPDGSGTFDITAAVQQTTLSGGPEGIVYVPPGSPQFVDFNNVLVSEWSDGNIAVYDVDVNGDPVPATRVVFVSGLTGAEGAVIDPLSGDFLFSTFGGGDRVIAVQGFAPLLEELCDGIDNDGDGEIDEGFDVGEPCTAGVGACAVEGVKVCTENGLGTECNAVPGMGAADDPTCDGIDDDCDGLVDEDYVPEPTTCGTGECASMGETQCVDGMVEDTCVPGEPVAEICDNELDDDCDGDVDGEDKDCMTAVCNDQDGDGYGSPGDPSCPAGEETDCNDADPLIHPGAVELPGTFDDENCDGVRACDPCDPWSTHGQFVSCVSQAVGEGTLAGSAGATLVSSAARSNVGKRGLVPPECGGGGGASSPGRGKSGRGRR